MRCAWEAYLNILPIWLRPLVDRLGREYLQELRLRLGYPPELILNNRSAFGDRLITQSDLAFCVNAASRYSPWSSTTSANGYITATGGHRVGICGDTVLVDGYVTGIQTPRSLCIRVARDIRGLAEKVAQISGSFLIIGPPGSGKTTFLRDLIRTVSEKTPGSISVVDERSELFPYTADENCFQCGKRTDILTGCTKEHGIEMVLRTMSPAVIAVDEITAKKDCDALIHAGWCGVKLFATAHAYDNHDLLHRPVYKPLIDSGLFDYLITLHRDKSWTLEGMEQCTVK